MGLDDFGLSILAGLLANRLDFSKPKGTSAQMNEVIPDVIEEPDKFSLSANLPKDSRHSTYGVIWTNC